MKKFILILVFFNLFYLQKINAASSKCIYYCKNRTQFGIGFSGGSYDGGSYLLFSGEFSYFLKNGVSTGVSILYQSYPSYFLPELILRIYLLPRSFFTPLFIAKAGYLLAFEPGYKNSVVISGGGGFSYFLNRHIMFTFYLIYQKYLSSLYTSGVTYGGGFGFIY